MSLPTTDRPTSFDLETSHLKKRKLLGLSVAGTSLGAFTSVFATIALNGENLSAAAASGSPSALLWISGPLFLGALFNMMTKKALPSYVESILNTENTPLQQASKLLSSFEKSANKAPYKVSHQALGTFMHLSDAERASLSENAQKIILRAQIQLVANKIMHENRQKTETLLLGFPMLQQETGRFLRAPLPVEDLQQLRDRLETHQTQATTYPWRLTITPPNEKIAPCTDLKKSLTKYSLLNLATGLAFGASAINPTIGAAFSAFGSIGLLGCLWGGVHNLALIHALPRLPHLRPKKKHTIDTSSLMLASTRVSELSLDKNARLQDAKKHLVKNRKHHLDVQ